MKPPGGTHHLVDCDSTDDVTLWDVSVPMDQLGPPSEWADDLILIATYQLELAVN
jgi:hypothetical protein